MFINKIVPISAIQTWRVQFTNFPSDGLDWVEREEYLHGVMRHNKKIFADDSLIGAW